jgi:hypothetical protein
MTRLEKIVQNMQQQAQYNIFQPRSVLQGSLLNPRLPNNLDKTNVVNHLYPYYCNTCKALHADDTFLYHHEALLEAVGEGTRSLDSLNMMTSGLEISTFGAKDQVNPSKRAPGSGSRLS